VVFGVEAMSSHRSQLPSLNVVRMSPRSIEGRHNTALPCPARADHLAQSCSRSLALLIDKAFAGSAQTVRDLSEAPMAAKLAQAADEQYARAPCVRSRLFIADLRKRYSRSRCGLGIDPRL